MRNGIQVPRGKVKFYDAEKGFGFILDDEDGQSVYVQIGRASCRERV